MDYNGLAPGSQDSEALPFCASFDATKIHVSRVFIEPILMVVSGTELESGALFYRSR